MLRRLSLPVACMVWFSPVTAYAQTGACCEDLTDGALRFEGCVDTDKNSCEGGARMFHVGATCGDAQACCLPFGDHILCFDESSSSGSPLCCLESGGVPQGDGTTCGSVVCGGTSIPAVSGRGLFVATFLVVALGSLIVHRRNRRFGSR